LEATDGVIAAFAFGGFIDFKSFLMECRLQILWHFFLRGNLKKGKQFFLSISHQLVLIIIPVLRVRNLGYVELIKYFKGTIALCWYLSSLTIE